MKMTGHVKHDTLAKYTYILDELLQGAPNEALARHLPAYEPKRETRMVRHIAGFMAGEEIACEEQDAEPRTR